MRTARHAPSIPPAPRAESRRAVASPKPLLARDGDGFSFGVRAPTLVTARWRFGVLSGQSFTPDIPDTGCLAP